MGDPTSEPNTADRDSAETTLAPSDAQTSAVNLAWSVGDTAPDVEAYAEGRRPLPRTLLAFLAGVAVAAVALGAFLLGLRQPDDDDTAPTQPISTAPSPTPSAALVSPPSAAPQPPTSSTSVEPPEPTSEPAPLAPEPPAIAAPESPVPDSTSPDDTFIAGLQAEGITFDTPALAVSVAHQVCLQFSLGNSTRDVVAAVKADNPSLPRTSAAHFVTMSVNAYCPQYG
jgi:type IV secretory pathway VirB10-like protein